MSLKIKAREVTGTIVIRKEEIWVAQLSRAWGATSPQIKEYLKTFKPKKRAKKNFKR